jgi:predicted aldo/keto reductase-like oxidoreductase
MKKVTISRRHFIGSSVTAGLAGLALPGLNPLLSQTAPKTEYRTLGKTGLKVSAVGYGCMRTREPAVIHRAIDLGINYFDTARRYMDGYNEAVLGQVLKTRRKEAFVATKITPDTNTEKGILDSFAASLKALATDYVDVIQLHAINTVDQITREETLKTLETIKKSGQARFIGFTTHSNQVELLKAAIPQKFFDVILVGYNFKSPAELTDAILKASEAGIGIVAMKTQAGGYADHEMGNISPHQAALKWALQNPGVHTTIPSMPTYAQLEENIQVMGTKMGWMDRKTLDRYGKAIDSKLCRMCGECRNQCSKNVDVLEINRALMYSEGYRDDVLARTAFAEIPRSKSAAMCQDCTACTVTCAFGLNIQNKMAQAQEFLRLA